jgi:hypothetical protein
MRAGAVAGLVLAALAVTGCEPAQLGAAAIVDGQRIPVDEVQATVADVRALQARVGQPARQPEALVRQELQRRLIMAVYERAAKEMGVRVTPGEVSAEHARARAAAGSEEEFASQVAGQNLSLDTAKEYLRQVLLARKMGEKLAPQSADPPAGGMPGQSAQDQAVEQRLIQTAKKMRFEVNPRYGEFNTENGQLLDRRDDFLRPQTGLPPSPGASP